MGNTVGGNVTDNQTPDDLIWGRHPVLEALRAERPLRRLLVAKGAHGPVIDEIFARARQAHIPYDLRDKAQLDRLAGPHHQSVVAYAAATSYADFDHLLAPPAELRPCSSFSTKCKIPTTSVPSSAAPTRSVRKA